MTSTQTMRSIQRFTSEGQIGIGLLLASPIVSGASYAWLLHEQAKGYSEILAASRGNVVLPCLLLFVCGLAFIIGACAVLIGREQITTVTNVEAHKASDFTSENYTEQTNREARESRQTAELLDRCGTSPRPVWSAY